MPALPGALTGSTGWYPKFYQLIVARDSAAQLCLSDPCPEPVPVPIGGAAALGGLSSPLGAALWGRRPLNSIWLRVTEP